MDARNIFFDGSWTMLHFLMFKPLLNTAFVEGDKKIHSINKTDTHTYR